MGTLLHRWEGLPRVRAAWCGPVLELWFWPSDHAWQELQDLIATERGVGPDLIWTLLQVYGCPLVRIETADGRPEPIECIAIFVGAASTNAVGEQHRHQVWTTPPTVS